MKNLFLFISLIVSAHGGENPTVESIPDDVHYYVPTTSILEEGREKWTEILTKRMSFYQPTDLKIKRGLSPRKLIKNLLPSGYYVVDFFSQKDKLNYNCYLTVQTPESYKVIGGISPGLYLMNCQNEYDDPFFHNEVVRLFNDLFPDKAKPKTVKIVYNDLENPLSSLYHYVTLLDSYFYTIQYENHNNELISCTAILGIGKKSVLVDQYLILKDCSVIGLRTPSKNQMQKEIYKEEYVRDLESMYDYYDGQLANRWPLDLEAYQSACTKAPPQYWMDLALKMIDTSVLHKEGEAKNNRLSQYAKRMKDHVLKNALITQAYNRLYIKSLTRRGGSTNEPFVWLASAAYASSQVGTIIRQSYRPIFLAGNIHSDADKDILKLLELETRQLAADSTNPILIAAAAAPHTSDTLIEGNQKVYVDIYWQMLAAITCGPGEMRRLAHERSQSATSEKEKLRYLEHEKAWGKIEGGMTRQDLSLIVEGNFHLVDIEQGYILQPTIYEPLPSKILNQLGLFNPYAKSIFYDPAEGPLETFNQFCSKNGIPNNLSYLPSRLKWMKYTVISQSKYLNKMGKDHGRIKSVFLSELIKPYIFLSRYL